jgi:NitT/TauT family transport system ATP-binding protein
MSETITEGPVESSGVEERPHPILLNEAAAAQQQQQQPLQPKPHIVEFTHVFKRFQESRGGPSLDVLKNFNFKIESKDAGAFVVLLGPSGCGKSTVLSLISGLALADEGEVCVLGKPVTGPTPESACVPQAYTCYPWLTVLKNVEFGLDVSGKPADKKERRALAMEYLTKVGLEDRCDAYPKQLSGGMQQRVAIARTLAMKLPVVLMDEPFGALDAQTRTDMQQMVLKLWGEEKNTIVFVTHDISEALLLGDRVIVFPSRPLCEEFFEMTNLDDKLGHDRPPELMHDKDFLELYEKLRQELKKKPPAPQP